MKDSVVIAPYDTGLYVMVCHFAENVLALCKLCIISCWKIVIVIKLMGVDDYLKNI